MMLRFYRREVTTSLEPLEYVRRRKYCGLLNLHSEEKLSNGGVLGKRATRRQHG